MELLTEIEWYIHAEPTLDSVDWCNPKKRRKGRVTKKVWETVVFPEASVKLRFPLNDYYTYFVVREVQGPLTVGGLLRVIYDFYQSNVVPEEFQRAMENADDEIWKDELLEMFEGDVSRIRNIDLLTDDPAPDLVDLEWSEDVEAYTVHLGPE